MNKEEDRAIQAADDALRARRLQEAADRAYRRLKPGEKRVLRLRFQDDPKKIAHFDALDALDALDDEL